MEAPDMSPDYRTVLELSGTLGTRDGKCAQGSESSAGQAGRPAVGTIHSSPPEARRRSSSPPSRFPGVIALVLAFVFSYSVAQAQPQLPSAPTALQATTYSKKQIDLVWNDPNPSPSGVQESGYVVERAKGTPTSWTKV